jgi:hypothetical protein
MIDPHIPQSTRRDGNAHHYDYEPTSPHFVEQAVQVYLRLSDDGSRWIIDGPSVDGRPLDSPHSDHTAQRDECARHRREECERAACYADQLPLPTAAELDTLITDALG